MIVLREQLPVHFAEVNLPQLELEMAMGKGEFLEAFAVTLGCENQAMDQFFEFSKKNYSEFMGNSSKTPAQRVQSIRSALKNDSRLNTLCPGMITG